MYTASLIESKVIENIKRCHKKECSLCINIFYENEIVEDEFIAMKNLSRPLKTPCLSTVHIVKASNKIFNTLEDQAVSEMTHFRYTEMTVKVLM